MAKVNPVMRHAKPALSAEQAAIEDFMQSIPPQVVVEGDTIIDNTIPEMIIQEDTSLDPLVDSVVAADQLDALAGDVDGITTAASMESFKRIFGHMTQLSGHPVASLENFPVTKGGVRKFAKAVRGHAATIRGCVSIAFEEYTDKVDESITTSMSNYKQALGELSQVDAKAIDVNGKVTVDHKRTWKLFHMNGELMDLKDFHVEVESIKSLADAVRKGKDNVVKWARGEDSSGPALEGKLFVQLMNDTDVAFKDGRAVFTELETPAPDKSWSASDYFWVFTFNMVGLAYRLLKGGTGEEHSKKEQSLQAISKVVDEMKRMAPLVQGIEKDAKEIISVIEKAKEDRKADLKRAASPVLELAAKTIQHVTLVTYGAKQMFQAAAK